MPKPSRYVLACAALLAAALAVRVACHVGVATFEPVFTAWSAHDVLSGTYVPQQHAPGSINNGRFLMVLPTALSAAVLGFGDVASTLWPMACGMALLLGVLVLGPGLFGEKASLIAGGLLAVVPGDVLYAGQLYSDLPMSAAWTWAALLFWRALDVKSPRLSMAAGLVAGLSWWIREPGPLILAVMLLWSWRAKATRLWLPAAAAALAVLIVDLVYYTFATGDPLFRFGIMTGGVHARYMAEDYYTTAGGVLFRVLLEVPAMMAWPGNRAFPYYAALPLLALIVVVSGGRTLLADASIRRIALWFGAIFVAFAFLPVSLFPFRPAMYLMPRTLIPFMVPAALLLGIGLARMKRGPIAAGGIAAACLGLLAWLTPQHRAGWPETREAIAVLEREGARTVITDEILSMTGARANFVAFHRQFDGEMEVYSWGLLVNAASDPEGEVYLLMHTANMADIQLPVYRDVERRHDTIVRGSVLLFKKEFRRPGDPRVHHVAVYKTSRNP